MNIYTFKLTKKRIVAAILVVAAIIALLILLIPGRERNEQARASSGAVSGIKNQADCISYLKSLGYEVNAATAETKTVTIPKQFDAVYTEYNAMMKECGFDLSRFSGKKVDLLTFQVTNYPGDDAVLLDVMVYKHQIVGGAVYTASVDGFMYGLKAMSS